MIECNRIPNIREEIPTPAVTQHYDHLRQLESMIPPLDENAEILMLIGRDLGEAHQVFDQIIGPKGTPFAQRLALGWVIIGETCLGKVHTPDVVNCNKTYLQSDDRSSIFIPCPNNLTVNDKINVNDTSITHLIWDGICGIDKVFETTANDNRISLSIDYGEFFKIMESEFYKDTDGKFGAPLPFKTPRHKMPSNRPHAIRRAKSLEISLNRDLQKKQHFFEFIEKVIKNGHAEVTPQLNHDEECWHLPIFGVYHPKKKDQIRVVFDSSAKHNEVSLNRVLLSGPDLVNSLLGVLLRFRKESVTITADIQQMFYCFKIRPDHRKFLRFLWYKDNDFNQELIEYRMCVHVFGNSPSPAVATYGLRKSAENSAPTFGLDVQEFINTNFYVDDGLASLPTSEQAISLMQRTQKALKAEGNLRLHKIALNREDVRAALYNEDLAKDLKELESSKDNIPLQRRLGLSHFK